MGLIKSEFFISNLCHTPPSHITSLCCWLFKSFRRQFLCCPWWFRRVLVYSIEGKDFPRGSVAALRGKLSWLWGATGSHCTANLTQEIYWERHRWWLPVLRREAAGIWAGGELYKRFLWTEFFRVEISTVEIGRISSSGIGGFDSFSNPEFGLNLLPSNKTQQVQQCFSSGIFVSVHVSPGLLCFLLNLFWSDVHEGNHDLLISPFAMLMCG